MISLIHEIKISHTLLCREAHDVKRAHMWQSGATDLSQVCPVSQVPGMDTSQRRPWGGVTPGFRSARGTSPPALCRCGEGRVPSGDG